MMKLQYQTPTALMTWVENEDILTLSTGDGTPKIGEDKNTIDFTA